MEFRYNYDCRSDLFIGTLLVSFINETEMDENKCVEFLKN
jgi:hypothetical protein